MAMGIHAPDGNRTLPDAAPPPAHPRRQREISTEHCAWRTTRAAVDPMK